MSQPVPSVQIIHADCIDAMRELLDNSIDSIVTDPPYGLGFMGKKWDDLPPGKEWAEECLRVLKPGGHMLAFGGTRTWHRLAVAIEDAGFEVRDSIAWLYGSGFPKHRAALKPAFEPVVMARKPFKGSLTANEAVYGTGALSIDASRLPTTDDLSGGTFGGIFSGSRNPDGSLPKAIGSGGKGRWPANVILDEGMAGVLDGQSGILKSGARKAGSTRNASSKSSIVLPDATVNDFTASEGGASRFFKVAKADEHGAISPYFPREFDAPFLYVAKAPKKERSVVDGVSHPTVKPLSLMRYLVKLVTPTGGTVLEPFAGSGATVEACLLEGFDVIAIEREAEYLPLIQRRIERNEVA